MSFLYFSECVFQQKAHNWPILKAACIVVSSAELSGLILVDFEVFDFFQKITFFCNFSEHV